MDKSVEVRELNLGELKKRANTKKANEPSYVGLWITDGSSISISSDDFMTISTPRSIAPHAELVLVFVKDWQPTTELLQQIRNRIDSASPKTRIVGYSINSQNWSASTLHSIISDLLFVDFPEFYRRKERKDGKLSLMPDPDDYIVDYYRDTNIGQVRLAFAVVHKVSNRST